MDKFGPINKTEMGPEIEKAGYERYRIHRDYIAHCLRWTYVLKNIKLGMNIIDIGCGSFPLFKALNSNMHAFRPALYVGIDIRKSVIEKMLNYKTNFKVKGYTRDIRVTKLPVECEYFDIATCLEVIEHFEEKYLDHILGEIKKILKPNGLLILSTPNFNGKLPKCHIHEYRAGELRVYLEKYFKVEKIIGTFASQKDIEPVLTETEKELYYKFEGWFTNEVFACLFAPLHPYQSRNILWVCRKG